MTLEARIKSRCLSLGISQAELARRSDIQPSQLQDIFSAKTGRSKHLPVIAANLGVSVEWLTTGVGPFPMSAASVRPLPPSSPLLPLQWAEHRPNPIERRADQITGGKEPPERPLSFVRDLVERPNHVRESDGTTLELAVIGSVSAGDGDLGPQWTSDHSTLRFPERWVAVKIHGNSAYPVAYPGQLALIDLDRATAPQQLDPETFHDLHDNLCLVQTREDGQNRAYLKRFCRDPRAPNGFVLASVDSGRGSPYIPADCIELIAPVVGVVFEDPREPRKKGRNRADVTTPRPGG